MTRAPGHPLAQPPDDLDGRRHRPAVEIGVAEDAGPAVEDLHDIGAGLELSGQRAHRRLDQDVDQRLRTGPAPAPRASAPAPGRWSPARRPCRSPPSTAPRRSRSASSPGASPPAPAGSSRTAAPAARRQPSERQRADARRIDRIEPRTFAFDEAHASPRAHRASSGYRKTRSPHRNPNRRIGCSVTSVARSGSRQRSRKERHSARIARYSGR